MKLYDAVTPNSLRVSVFLAEKGIDLPREHIAVLDGGTRTPAFLAMNSLGELPLLQLDDGRHLAESVAICRYLEALYPDPPLFGRDPVDRAFVEMWARRVEIHLFGSIGNVARHTFPFFADKVEQDAGFAASQARAFDAACTWFNDSLADGRPFIVGNHFSVADITGMAMLMVCDLMEKAIPDALQHAKRWERRMRSRGSFANQRSNAA